VPFERASMVLTVRIRQRVGVFGVDGFDDDDIGFALDVDAQRSRIEVRRAALTVGLRGAQHVFVVEHTYTGQLEALVRGVVGPLEILYDGLAVSTATFWNRRDRSHVIRMVLSRMMRCSIYYDAFLLYDT